jgi:hypothetical protein
MYSAHRLRERYRLDLGVLLRCPVYSGAVVVGLIRGQMRQLADEAMREIWAGDLHKLRTFLRE